MTSKAIMADRLYIPLDWLECQSGGIPRFTKPFTHKFKRKHHTYADKGKEYIETIETFNVGNKYIRFERGDYQKVKTFFRKCPLTDKRVTPSFEDKFPGLKFTSTLRPEQATAADEWMKAQHGVIKAPTRWGKMVVMVYIAVKMGMRFLGVTHTRELRDQMDAEFRIHTNISQLEKEYSQKLIGTYDYEDSKKRVVYPIATFATYQAFLSTKGKTALGGLRKKFGLVWVTEAHLTPARCFSQVLAEFWAKHKGGDTATPHRKDGTEVVMFDILGPITSHGSTEQLACEVVFEYSGMFVPERLDNWTRLITKLSKDMDRNLKIILKIMEDVDDGRHVLVLTERVEHTIYLANYLKQEGYKAAALFGALRKDKREQALTDAKSGDIDVLVSVAKIVQHGITVPLWDCLHLTMPSNNPVSIEQRAGRVRTPSPGKRTPVIRDWMDRDANPLIFYTARTRRKVYERLEFPITNNIPASLRDSSGVGMRKGNYKPV